MQVADFMACGAAGADTWSPSWYVNSREVAAVLQEQAVVPAGGGARMLQEPVAGHRVGWFPNSSLMFAEGHPETDELASGPALVDRLADLIVDLGVRGLPLDACRFAGLRRLDATADLRFTSKAAGLAALVALSVVDFPRSKKVVHYGLQNGMAETVEIKGYAGRKTLGRMYDKGIESGTDLPGSWIRLEDQSRFSKQNRPDVTLAGASYLRERFHRRFVPLWKANKGVTVTGPLVLHEALAAKVERGELTYSQAARLAGNYALERAGCVPESQRSHYRYRAEAREAGVYCEESFDDEMCVDVEQVLEAALDSPGWGVG